MIGKTYNDRPVYKKTVDGELIFFKGEIFLIWTIIILLHFQDDLWRSCEACNYEDDGADIGPVKSKFNSLMIPRLPFHEWEGFESQASEFVTV